MCSGNSVCTWRALLAAATIGWALVYWWLAIEKIVLFGAYQYVIHLTNHSWTYQALTLSALPFFIVPPTIACANVNVLATCVGWCFAPVWLLVWYVAGTVFLLLVRDPEFITDLFDRMEPGLVIIGNDVFHIVPAITFIFIAWLHAALIYLSLNRFFVSARRCGGTPAVVAGFCYQALGGTLALALVYFGVVTLLGTSPNEVYHTDFPTLGALGYLVVIAVFANVVPLTILCVCCRLGKPSLTPRYDVARAMGKTTTEIFGKRVTDVESMLDESIDELALSEALRSVEQEQQQQQQQDAPLIRVTSRRRTSPLRFRFT